MHKSPILPLLLFTAIVLSSHAQDAPPAGGAPENGPQTRGWAGGARGTGGTATAISGTTLTIKTEEGDTYQVFTSANTRVMKQREPVKITDIHVGDAIMAGGQMDAKAKTVGAVFVAVLSPEQAAEAKKRRAEFGKTWTGGEITEIKDTNITVKRMDGVTQTFTVDENTSFKKHRDSITLADIQVGDRAMAEGSLKGGVFVATSVNVRSAGEGRGADGVPPGPPTQ